jgi:hypothetical protein
MGGIHLFLVFQWAGGLLGVLFVLNAIGGLVLAIAMLAARRPLLGLASLLSLVFMAGTLLALVFALTVGLFGITEQLSTALVVPTFRRGVGWHGRARGDDHPGIPDGREA